MITQRITQKPGLQLRGLIPLQDPPRSARSAAGAGTTSVCTTWTAYRMEAKWRSDYTTTDRATLIMACWANANSWGSLPFLSSTCCT